MIEAFSLPFMQRALLAGLLAGLMASYLGVFIVQRRLAFLGAGLAHSAFGGVALGLLLGVEPLAIALPFTVLAAIGITWIRQHTQLGGDTAVGIFFAVAMAMGIIFLSLKQDYTTEAFSYLFGSILAVTSTDLAAAAIVMLIVAATLPLWSRWAYSTFDNELAEADHLTTRRDDYILSILIAVVVVTAVKVLGIVLIAAFLVIPAATARLLARTFFGMTVLSILIGVLSTITGLMASFLLDVPSGATIILVEALLFLVALPFQRA